MSFSAQVIRVLIASPSDVSSEREIAVRAIQEWNDLNSAERQIVLLPLRWETHSAPEYGSRPQEVINRQIVDHCDILVGIFWTRIGSPTGFADSGTIEEIERVALKGKPVMLYFSKAKHDPDSIDIEQLAKLRDFKRKTFPKALVESYGDVIEFKDKLSKQIEIQLRTLLAEQTKGGTSDRTIRPITDIILSLADPESGAELGATSTIKTTFLEISGFDTIPDYAPEPKKTEDILDANWLAALNSLKRSEFNKNFYRQRVTSIVIREFFSPIRFWLKNAGGVGARDVYIDLRFQSDSDTFVMIARSALPNATPSATASSGLLSTRHPNSPDDLIHDKSESWSTHMEIAALQPQRELSPSVDYMIGAKEDCVVKVQATIFADSLPEPLNQELTIHLKVSKMNADASSIMSEIILPTESAEVHKSTSRANFSVEPPLASFASKKRTKSTLKSPKPTPKI